MKKIIDVGPVVAKLAAMALQAKGRECSLLGSVIDMLRTAPDVTDINVGHKWVPVSERLPENELDRVLVATDCDNPFGNQKIDTDRYRNGKWVRYGDHVTHWMPLSKPPEEDD